MKQRNRKRRTTSKNIKFKRDGSNKKNICKYLKSICKNCSKKSKKLCLCTNMKNKNKLIFI